MLESMEPLLYTTIVPSHYDVYLHQSDYDRLSGIFPKIQEQARQALDEEIARLSRKGRSLLNGLKNASSRFEAAEGCSYIKFHKDEDEELKPGEILVDSRLTLPPEREYGVGAKTQRTVTVRSRGENRKLQTIQEPAAVERPAVAKITYVDKEGRRQEYRMSSAEIAIGRGGRAEYCDLALDGPMDISRQHFYLRHDEATRNFFIQDVSKFGTSVNGKRIAPKEWVLLPPKARITMADKVEIDFEAL
jgi:hypothetical protein